MEIIQDDAKKLVQVWLSRKESGDEALQNQLKPMYAQWKQQKYMVAVFHSGRTPWPCWRITNGAVRNWRCSGRRSRKPHRWNCNLLQFPPWKLECKSPCRCRRNICRGCILQFITFGIDNTAAICFQLWNILRQNFPGDLRINGAIAVCHNIPHTANLPPRRAWMFCTEFIRQLSGQFSDLKDTQCCCVPVDRVRGKYTIVISEAANCLLYLVAIAYDMLQNADIPVKRLHTAAPHHQK